MTIHSMITPDNCTLALIDFQPAMYQGVYSHDRITVIENVQILAKAAKLFDLPTIISTVAQDTFSGPFMPEVTELFPNQTPIDRTSINAWIDDQFRSAIEATGRKKIVLAGLWTEACVLFPAINLLEAGYEVYFVADACGDVTPEAHERAVQRLIQADTVPMTAMQFLFELQQDWARSATYEGVTDILKAHTAYGTQIRFSKWALGEHASEAGTALGRMK
jgi:nicotinamidase-related amidase